jgi:hypothetical protein
MPTQISWDEASARTIVEDLSHLEGAMLPILHALQGAFGYVDPRAAPHRCLSRVGRPLGRNQDALTEDRFKCRCFKSVSSFNDRFHSRQPIFCDPVLNLVRTGPTLAKLKTHTPFWLSKALPRVSKYASSSPS